MESGSGNALELVVFKLKEGVSREDLLMTAEGVSDWIKKQPGFISRDLSYDAAGDRWIEVVRWGSLDEAHAASELAMSSESCRPMFGLIDMASTLMIHGVPAIAPVHA
jgi:hypothetical protein